MMFENQLRRAIDLTRHNLIEHLKALSNDDETPFEQLTLSELEIEWRYYQNAENDQAN